MLDENIIKTNNILPPECGQILKSLTRSTSAEHMKLTHTMQRESNVDSEWRYVGILNRGKRDSKIHFGFFNKSDGN